jgi:hypothetical protein
MDVQGPKVERCEIIYKLFSRLDYSLDLDVDVVTAVSVSVILSMGCGRDASGCLQAFEEGSVYSAPRS